MCMTYDAGLQIVCTKTSHYFEKLVRKLSVSVKLRLAVFSQC